jgi:L-ascorbate metabolism protein UlaG (beta-lactamase superfamily)
MVKRAEEETRILGPRSRGLRFVPYTGRVLALAVGETIDFDGVQVQGLYTAHGPIEIRVFGLRMRQTPGAEERVGFGSMGFRIQVNSKTIVNLGDSVFQREWAGLSPDVLMIPICGLGDNTWTMDVTEALDAVRLISPKLVIPCHYSVPVVGKFRLGPADDRQFKREVEKLGIECSIMQYGDTIEIEDDRERV